jgi:hypothetical protein
LQEPERTTYEHKTQGSIESHGWQAGYNAPEGENIHEPSQHDHQANAKHKDARGINGGPQEGKNMNICLEFHLAPSANHQKKNTCNKIIEPPFLAAQCPGDQTI